MRNVIRSIGCVLLGLMILSAAPRAQDLPTSGSTMSLDGFIDRLAKVEAALPARMGSFHPVVEVYLQHLMAADPASGPIPIRDDYFLGQFDGKDRPDMQPLNAGRGWFRPAGLMNRPFGFEYVPAGFAATTVPDRQALDRDRYAFSFVRREFLDEVRTVVLDVQPKDRDGDGFKGRIWVEDREFNIVRFNGISREVDRSLSRFFKKKLSFHVDSWRVNVRPGVWLPAYVYFEETDFNDYKTASPETPKIKGQMRLWGYELKDANAPSAFATIQIGDGAQDVAEQARPVSPVLSQRRWETEAENNILDRLTNAGLLAPAGPVDGVLNTVLNNLQVTNELEFDPPLKARVLLTSTLESFIVGRTIVLSRGLIDVLPDEASLAMVIGHELAHVTLGHLLVDTKFAFADRLMIPDTQVVSTLRFNHTQTEEAAADEKLLQLLSKSPYKDKLATAGLFLKAIQASAKALPNLIQPHVGDYVRGEEQTLMPLIEASPELEPGRLDQVAALPLGARVLLDPWSNKLDLNRAPAVPLYWAREKLTFAITPMSPYLKYAVGDAVVTSK